VRDEIAGGCDLRERKTNKKIDPTEVPWATAQAPMVGVFRVKRLNEPEWALRKFKFGIAAFAVEKFSAI
jgi:hypothetical protein